MGGQALKGKGRRQAFMLSTDQLTMIEEPDHPLYDERIHLPLDEETVKSIMEIGVQVAIKVRKNGQKVEIVDGRQRYRHTIEANKRLRDQGVEREILIPCEVARGKDGWLARLGMILNEKRRADDPVTRAKKMQRLLGLVGDKKVVASDFGVTVQTLDRNLALLDLDPKVQTAVAQKRLGPTYAAKTYAKLERAEQVKLLKEEDRKGLLGDGEKRAYTGPKKKKGPKSQTASSGPGKRLVKRVAAGSVTPAVREALMWAIGELESPSGKLGKAIAAAADDGA